MIEPIDVINALNFERLAATAGENAGIELISKFVETCGFKPDVESYEINSFNAGTAEITVGELKVNAVPFGLCADVELSGELAFVENADRIKVDQGLYNGKIILCYGQPRDLNNVMKEGGIKAFIRITPPHRKAYQAGHHQTAFDEGAMPVVTVTYEDGVALSKLSGSELSLKIEQNSFKANAHNIVVDVKGTNPDNNLTTLVAHFDTVANTPGSSDNAAGCACLVKILEFFGQNPPRRDLRVVFCSGEELGLLGSRAYVDAHKEEIEKRVKLNINIDVSGDSLGTDQFTVLGTKEILGYVDGIARENGLFFKTALDIYSSDCMPFAEQEVPTINIARFGGAPSFYIHTEEDTPKHICNDALNRSATAGRLILDRVLNAEIYPVTKAIDESLREKVEKFHYHNCRTEPKLNWEPKYKK